ncbi:APC family permease [Streptomyces beihaiensis]|uniref:APC family permease n=1 Tax=Streptomyces beihaiensis TaxID=2984495 RepID=A0ABT3TPQ6_9ACTN|nr:APC family permease [Streptomyces beihaiensis]MCX3059017.1 APC family permease [Streptomyces beihaiensis]
MRSIRTQPPGLRRSLGVVDGIAVAASSTAATTSIGIGMGSLAATVGLQAPAVLLVAFVPILGIAAAYARLNRHEPNMGNGYVWVGRTLGPWLGFLTGWVTLVGTLVFMAYTSAVTGSVVLQFALQAHLRSVLGIRLDPDSTALSTVVGLVVLALVTVTAVTGIRKATRLQAWLLGFEYAVLLGFCGWSLVTGGHAFRWEWLDPFAVHDGGALAQGLVLGVFFFWGWDAAFTVTEETKDVRDAGRGGFIALFAMLALFLYGSVAFQREMSLPELVQEGPQALTYLGARLASEPWASLPLLALLFSAVASLQASVIPTARGLLAMGRDRTLGPLWTRVSPRYGSPALGTVVIMAVAAGLALLAVAIPKLSQMILAAVNSIGLTVALYYGLTALACTVRFRGMLRTSPVEALRAVVAPGLSGVALLGVGAYLARSYALRSDHFALSPDNGWFLLVVPGAIVVSGLAMAAFAKYRRRSPYFATGRGTDAQSPELDSAPVT